SQWCASKANGKATDGERDPPQSASPARQTACGAMPVVRFARPTRQGILTGACCESPVFTNPAMSRGRLTALLGSPRLHPATTTYSVLRRAATSGELEMRSPKSAGLSASVRRDFGENAD